MAKCSLTCVVVLVALATAVSGAQDLFSTPLEDANGRRLTLEKYRGRVLLIVNVASECGFTDGHYKGLVKLQKMFGRLQVLGFPCNQFGAQEPADAASVEQWAKATYGINFPIFGKINVINENASPLFQYLIAATAKEPTWNFWKYLVNHEGKVLNAWGPWQDIEAIFSDVKAAIDAIPSDAPGSRGPLRPASTRTATGPNSSAESKRPVSPPSIQPPAKEKHTRPMSPPAPRMKHDDL